MQKVEKGMGAEHNRIVNECLGARGEKENNTTAAPFESHGEAHTPGASRKQRDDVTGGFCPRAPTAPWPMPPYYYSPILKQY
jgi:hypothetical protein